MGSTLFYNIASLVQVESNRSLKKTGPKMGDVAEIRDAYLLIDSGKITGLGPMKNAPSREKGSESVDCSGRVVLPGFVDSHTHVLYAGDRSDEFEMRAAGKSYEEIARAGGGIKRSVAEIANASEDQLIQETLPRLHEMLRHGTTTVEIKSGYGLSLESELKMLRAIQKLKKRIPIEIHATFLGAHDIPQGVKRETYIRSIIQEMIPQVVEEKLAIFCDVFCDRGFFTPEETRKIGLAALEKGLRLRIHANELGNTGGVEIATELEACSADHLIYLEESQIKKLATGKTVATLLPGTSFFLGLPYAPARQLIDQGATVALATDANPGSCTATSMPLIQNIATTQMKMTPAEALVASTLHGAAGLGIADRLGSLEAGKQADLIVTKPMKNFREIAYRLGGNPCWKVYKNGQPVVEN